MSTKLIDGLRRRYEDLSGSYGTLADKIAEEGREPSDVEVRNLEAFDAEMKPLEERINQLIEVETRKQKALTAFESAPPDLEYREGTRTPVVQVRSEEATYRRDLSDRSFFKDLFDSTTGGDLEARSRLERNDLENRVLGTSGTSPGNMPPPWLISEYAPIAHGQRPITDTLRRLPIDDARPITIGIQGPPPNALIANQAAEGNEPIDGSFTSTPLVTVPQTKTGKVNVSRQLLDGSSPIVDAIIYGDLMGALAENIETTVVAAFTALAAGAIAGNFPIDLATDVIPDAVIDAGTAIRLGRHSPPSVLFPSEQLWANIVKQKDAAGRPLVVTGYHGPQNALGLGEAIVYGHVAGELVGLPVVPSWALPQGVGYLVKADDLLVLESPTLQFRYEEVLGPQAIRLGVWEYFAVVLQRYPLGIARLTATGALPLAAGAPAPAKK